MSSPPRTTYFTGDAELADLGGVRFNHDVAAVGDKDYALRGPAPVHVQAGRAPRGLEIQVHMWNTFQYMTDERNEKEEKKGDLHEGQLHRANRAAAGGAGLMGTNAVISNTNPVFSGPVMAHEGRPAPYGNGGMRGGRGGRGGMGGRSGGVTGGGPMRGQAGGQLDALCAARKPAHPALPCAKGIAEELDKSLFWDGPICDLNV
ncbi:hypothetical protein E8E13_001596 [Curvularia kusanoi]|uniref:Uncharacterized protein n=1 Tax=Curvularia kusanoi TaxID=90978 RepID=A0A9P4TA37_CURKU|nr:hypothetical protein E8E13_001596 [Curvularia kusanoi]